MFEKTVFQLDSMFVFAKKKKNDIIFRKSLKSVSLSFVNDMFGFFFFFFCFVFGKK